MAIVFQFICINMVFADQQPTLVTEKPEQGANTKAIAIEALPASVVFQSQYELTAKLMKAIIAEKPDSNILIAPGSLARSMRLVVSGAKGKTLNELEHLFPQASVGLNDLANEIHVSDKVSKWNAGFIAESNGGYGLMVEQVEPGSAASSAGLAVNDLIFRINGITIRQSDALPAIIENSNGKIELDIYRFRTGELAKCNFMLTKIMAQRPTVALSDNRYIVFQKKMQVDDRFFHTSAEKFGGKWLRYDFANRMPRLPTDWKGMPFTSPETLNRELLASDSNTRMMILSEVILKSPWQGKFFEIDSKDFSFESVAGKKLQTPAFGADRRAFLLANDSLEMVELPLHEKGYSVFFLKPRTGDAKSHVIALNQPFPELTEQMQSSQVNLAIPKFRFSSETSFRPTLEKLGVQSAFSDEADFSLISSENSLKISSVKQAAEITCDHSGVSAQAVTTIRAIIKNAPAERKFHLNQPFLFLITHQNSGEIVFAGRVVNP